MSFFVLYVLYPSMTVYLSSGTLFSRTSSVHEANGVCEK